MRIIVFYARKFVLLHDGLLSLVIPTLHGTQHMYHGRAHDTATVIQHQMIQTHTESDPKRWCITAILPPMSLLKVFHQETNSGSILGHVFSLIQTFFSFPDLCTTLEDEPKRSESAYGKNQKVLNEKAHLTNQNNGRDG